MFSLVRASHERSMLKTVIITLVIAFIAFEILEHVVVPLVWIILRRKKPSVSGSEALLGQVVEVRQWDNTEGRVFVRGELWKAVSESPLLVGEKAVVENVDGLTLIVRSLEDGSKLPESS